MEMILKTTLRSSEIKTTKEKRGFLTFPSRFLATCRIEEEKDEITFLFEVAGLESAEVLKNASLHERLRFLYNAGELAALALQYDFSLAPSNLQVDINLSPKVLQRDSRNEESIDFIIAYKALIGCMLLKGSSYQSFLQGQSLFSKNKLLAAIQALETVAEIQELLTKEYQQIVAEEKATKQPVLRSRVRLVRILVPVLAVLLLVSGYFISQSTFSTVPFQSSLLAAKHAYIGNEPLQVQQILQDYPLERLPYETRYILARSFVATEALGDQQIQRILTGLTLRTEMATFDYWIHLGRLEVEEAIEIARRFNEPELLLFAYLRYEVLIENDHTMDGQEKMQLLREIGNQIETLQSDREIDEEE